MAATAPTATQAPSRSDDWISSEHSRLALPSWVLSGLFHGLILAFLILLSQSKGCQSGYPGEGGEDFRQVGVFLTSGETQDEPPPNETIEAATSEAATAEVAESPLLDGPPVELNLPAAASQPVLGLGAAPSVTGGGSAAPSLPSGAITGPPPSTGTAMGGATSLFGITDAGRRFAYVLDRSGSMHDFGAIRVAKAELKSSLQRLDATQQFQVIFYSNAPVMLDPRNTRSDMFRGTDTHRLEVDRQVAAVDPDGGTNHIPALEMALKLNPDVIFFLTDGAGVTLSDADLAGIKQRNNGGARIHCIEFGKSNLGRGVKNFLQKLAEQNDGEYQYRDVTRF
jgi:hypothetical protein